MMLLAHFAAFAVFAAATVILVAQTVCLTWIWLALGDRIARNIGAVCVILAIFCAIVAAQLFPLTIVLTAKP